ncbi:spexin prohormone 1 isoform X2 [Nelusetta ayraudi]|uniref:spexin prohormone 1 isoform X2 n=1 Tax=Nelusetta ayraudi TaxID=303726 RepID=UPI003F713D8E
MKRLRTVTLTYALTLALLAALVSQSCSAPKASFQRRNWTPQAMLYLKGTQGRRFISEDRKEGDVYDTLHLETRSQNTEKLSVDQAASVLLNFLQQARQAGADENPEEVYFQELPVWKREYF